LYGLREEKYNWLKARDVSNVPYQEIQTKTPYYFFMPRATGGIQHYLDWPQITHIFPVNVTGIVTARDRFVIGFNADELRQHIMQFRNLSLPNEIIREAYKLKDTRGLKLPLARKKLANDANWDTYYQKILYRPFDIRYIYYTPIMIDWGRPDVMRHMLSEENLALIVPKRVEHVGGWQHAFVSSEITEHVAVSLKTTDYHFPLYLYTDVKKPEMFMPRKAPNIAP
jgi:predicted helicase